MAYVSEVFSQYAERRKIKLPKKKELYGFNWVFGLNRMVQLLSFF